MRGAQIKVQIKMSAKPHNKCLLILCGLPGAGKTFLAARLKDFLSLLFTVTNLEFDEMGAKIDNSETQKEIREKSFQVISEKFQVEKRTLQNN
jgi:adenylylsulfate kinase-like enzyme